MELNLSLDGIMYEKHKKHPFLLRRFIIIIIHLSFVFWVLEGIIKMRVTLRDAKEHGIWILWYKNGPKLEKSSFKDGMLNRVLTGWHRNGQKELEGHYKDGKWKAYANTGGIMARNKMSCWLLFYDSTIYFFANLTISEISICSAFIAYRNKP